MGCLVHASNVLALAAMAHTRSVERDLDGVAFSSSWNLEHLQQEQRRVLVVVMGRRDGCQIHFWFVVVFGSAAGSMTKRKLPDGLSSW